MNSFGCLVIHSDTKSQIVCKIRISRKLRFLIIKSLIESLQKTVFTDFWFLWNFLAVLHHCELFWLLGNTQWYKISNYMQYLDFKKASIFDLRIFNFSKSSKTVFIDFWFLWNFLAVLHHCELFWLLGNTQWYKMS